MSVSATGDGSRRHQEVDSPVVQDGEREAELAKIKRWNREAEYWEGDDYLWRNRFLATSDVVARLVVERDAAERALETYRLALQNAQGIAVNGTGSDEDTPWLRLDAIDALVYRTLPGDEA